MAQRINFLPYQEGEGAPSALESRRRIMLNTPHLVTAPSAGLVTFETDMRAPLKECKVHFSPVQEGTGTPSPDNVRLISGWTGTNVTVSPTQQSDDSQTVNVDWTDSAGTVYGGYVALAMGEVYATHTAIRMKAYYWNWYTAYTFYIPTAKGLTSKYLISDTFPTSNTKGYPSANQSFGIYSNGASYANMIFFKHTDYKSGAQATADFNAWLQALDGDPMVVYERAAPKLMGTIDPITLKTLRGLNNIWSDANGVIDLTYWTHKE